MAFSLRTFFQSPLHKVPHELREALVRELDYSNIQRTHRLAHANIWLTLFSILGMDIVNIYHVTDTVLHKFWIIHGLMLLASPVYFFVVPKVKILKKELTTFHAVFSTCWVLFITFCVAMLSYVNDVVYFDIRFAGLVAQELLMLSTLFYHYKTLILWNIWVFALFTLDAKTMEFFGSEYREVANIVVISLILCNIANRYMLQSRIETFLYSQQILTEAEERRKINEQLQESLQTITDLHAEVQHQNQRLSYLNQQRDELFGIATHDLKNPLAAIATNVDIFKYHYDKLTMGEREQRLDKIAQLTQQMSEKIQYFLSINAVEERLTHNQSVIFNAVPIFYATLETMRELANNKNMTIHSNLSDISLMLRGDEHSLADILTNIISNAIKYSPPHSTIYLTCTSNNKSIVISVEDEGPGIRKDEQPLLFRRYKRLSSVPTGGESSSGLGLAITKRLTEEIFMGTITYHDGQKGGSVFSVELPLA
jgi:signal transduction histidine kinase